MHIKYEEGGRILALATFRTVAVAKAAVRTMSSKALAPLSDRFFLFNFFDNPVPEDEPFFDYWLNVDNYVVTIDGHVSTHLHRSVDSLNRFPWVNFIVFKHDRVGPLGYSDPKFEKMVAEEKVDMEVRPGKYVEIGSYNDEDLTYAEKDRSDSTRFLITAVMAEDSVSCEDLEKNWKKWMKVDYIQEKMKEYDVKDSLIYKQLVALIPRPPHIRYVVRTEVTNISDEEGEKFAKEVDQLANEPGVTTDTGCFKIRINTRPNKNQ